MGGSVSGVSNRPATNVRGQDAQLSVWRNDIHMGPRLAAREPRTPRKPLLTAKRDSMPVSPRKE